MIPPIAHFVWIGRLPPWALRNVQSFRDLHPDWDVRLWRSQPDDMPASFRRRLDACHQLCQVADILYVWLLRRYGGFCIDCDSITLRNFDPLRASEAVTTYHPAGGNSRRLTNGCWGAAAGTRAAKRMVEYVESAEPVMADGGVARCFYGPDMLTTLFAGDDDNDMTVLPWHYFYRFGEQPSERADSLAFFHADADGRQRALQRIAERFVDGVWPYAAHTWGMDGSSQREAPANAATGV